VARGLILETTVLMDLEREAARGEKGPARSFLEARAGERLYLTQVTAGELAAGSRTEDRQRWLDFLARFELLEPDLRTAWRYGRTFRYLKENGLLIGTNDLWIAAAALVADLPLVTRNEREFRRVPGLVVLSY